MFTWDSVELAIDTPFDPAFPWLQPARTRGNLLSLDRRWLAATSPASPFLPVSRRICGLNGGKGYRTGLTWTEWSWKRSGITLMEWYI